MQGFFPAESAAMCKVSALRCFAVVSQKRKDGLSLLRI